MNKPAFISVVSILIISFQIVSISCQKTSISEPSNPLIGTWKMLGAIDSAGNEIELLKDEVGYNTVLENGTFFRLEFYKDYFTNLEAPSTLEDYQKISANSWVQIGTYEIDAENNVFTGKILVNMNREGALQEFTVNYEIVNDTLTWSFSDQKMYFKNVRVK